MNVGHYDVNDPIVSIVTWTAIKLSNESEWYFVLPNKSRNRIKGIVVKVYDDIKI